jgi:hypothetical protein
MRIMLSYTNSFKYKHTLENTEGAIKNAQSRETGKKTKKNKTKTHHYTQTITNNVNTT